MYNLIFFALAGCLSSPHEAESIGIIWEDSSAVAVTIPKHMAESSSSKLSVRMEGSAVDVIGEIGEEGSNYRFTPAIPFTRGLSYLILLDDQQLGVFAVPRSTNAAPLVVDVFPVIDTLPSNLLKVYVQFSRPMREGRALDATYLLAADGDTVGDVFLNLQPELWNRESTLLTLWLDPGRIKRELQPNKKLGNPLQAGKTYTLIVARKWEDRLGAGLAEEYKKRFTVGPRDDRAPTLENWKFKLPKPGSRAAVEFRWNESLDYVLLLNTLKIKGEDQNYLSGHFTVARSGKSASFEPVEPWKAGAYLLEVESRLEDLAGNNLNRLFDRDLVRDSAAEEEYHYRRFVIQR